MKKIILLFVIFALFRTASAQVFVDFEILGFADENGNPVSTLVLGPTQDLSPSPILKNNGPDAIVASDSVYIDIVYNNDTYLTYIYLTGQQLHSVSAGEQVTINPVQPIWSAAVMDEYNLVSCTLCYEVRISGHSVDPNPNNNTACVEITRTVGIDESLDAETSLFPNPATSFVTLSGAAGKNVQFFDLTGKMVLNHEKISASQSFDISSLAEGLYIVRVSDGKKIVVKKLSVVR